MIAIYQIPKDKNMRWDELDNIYYEFSSPDPKTSFKTNESNIQEIFWQEVLQVFVLYFFDIATNSFKK